jgi:hypothetical protein
MKTAVCITKAEPINPHEWNFDPVPDGELVACCYWEYARESARIRAAFVPDDKVFFPNPPPTYVVSPAGVRMKTGSAINTARARFIDQIHEQSFPLLKILPGAINEAASPFDVPWQRKCPLPGVAMGKPTGQGHERRPALSSRGFFHFCRQKMRRSIGRPPVGAGNRWAGNPTLLRTISFRRHRVKMATCLRH